MWSFRNLQISSFYSLLLSTMKHASDVNRNVSIERSKPSRMKFLLLFMIGVALADDQSSCKTKCEAKFDDENVKTACRVGCEGRGTLENGPLMFVGCHQTCDNKYVNKTEEQAGCAFACTLPFTSSVFMTLDMTSENGQPRWKVIRQEGDDMPMSSFSDFSSEESPLMSILRPQDVNGNLLALKAPSSSSESSERGQIGSMPNFDQIHARMQKLMNEFSRKFVQDIRQNSMFDNRENVALTRPSGHDSWANQGSQVGNIGEDGQPMILSRPLEYDETPEQGRAFMIEFHRREPRRSRLLAAFHWSLIGVGVAALLTTICAIAMFLRNIRANSYRRMRGEGVFPIFSRVQPSAPGPVPVKKVPEEGWVESSEPSGVPPPAYDQVSIHSVKKSTENKEKEEGKETSSQ